MTGKTLFSALGAAALATVPALAQEATEEELGRAGEAADVMMSEVYVNVPAAGVAPADVVAKLEELGYRQIQDFDVEWGEYEVEAVSPAGEEVEIEIDPATGRILDIEENFF